MKKVEAANDDFEEMPDEIDFSGAERGRYAGRFSYDVTMVVLESDVSQVFPDSAAVNAALRLLLKAGAQAVKVKSKARKVS